MASLESLVNRSVICDPGLLSFDAPTGDDFACLSGFAWEGWAAGLEGRQGRVRCHRTERNQGKSLSNGRQHKMNFLSA